MAKNESISIDDEWVNLNELSFPAGTTIAEIEKILVVKPIRVRLEVILPKGSAAPDFNYTKNLELKKFRATLESKAAEALGQIAEEDQPAEGKKALDRINSYLEKAGPAFRVLLRKVIASEIGGTCKPDDLMTAGSINFQKFEFQFGFGDSDEEKFALLDLTKAFKRLKKVQQLGVAWKANKIVVSVRFRKVFKQAELKELRELLPEGSSRGAHMSAGQFLALAKGNVELNFPENATIPHEILLRKAFKKQVGKAVNTKVGTMEPEVESEEKKSKKKGEKKTKDEEETPTPKTTIKKKAAAKKK